LSQARRRTPPHAGDGPLSRNSQVNTSCQFVNQKSKRSI
jgi:hypothetical protein